MSGAPDTPTDALSAPDVTARTAEGAGLRLGAYVASVLLSVGSAAVLLRYLGVADYGRYVTIFALVTIVSGVTEAGTANVGVRELAVRDRAEHDGILAALQGIRLTLTAAGVALALLFLLAAGYDGEMLGGAALAGAGLLLTVFAMTLWIPLQADVRLPRVAALELLRQVLTVVVLLALVAGGASLAGLLAAQIPVAVGLISAGLLATHASLRAEFDRAAWRRLLAHTLPYATATAIGLVYSSSVVLAMSVVASETETGLYGAASRIFVVLAGSAGILVGSAFPLLARAGRDDRERLRTGVQRLFDVFLAASVGLAIVTAAGAPVAIDIVAGGDYDGSDPVLRLLAAAIPASFLLVLGAFALLSLGRQKLLIAVNGSGLLVAVVLTLALTPDGGAESGAVATIVGESLIAVLTFAALAKAGITPRLHALPKVALAAAAAAIPALLLPALPAAVLAAAVYTAAALALGLVPEELLRRLRR
jgi:O-antigen/teichoic acid export membrane protein